MLTARVEAGVLVVRLDGPGGIPRLGCALLDELSSLVASLPARGDVRGVVLTGTGRAFAAGAEVGEVGALTPLEAFEFARRGQALMTAVERLPLPVVAAVRGWCLGGGFDLAMACHVRIAAADAQFGHPGGALGILTGWGGTQRLPSLVGAGHARELLSAGRTIGAGEALACRLVSRVAPAESVVARAVSLAGAVCRVIQM